MVYAYSFTRDGQTFVTHVAGDSRSCEGLPSKMVEEMFRAGLGGYAIYAHNFRRFDSVFMLGLAAQIKSQGRRADILLDSTQRRVISLTVYPPASASTDGPIVFMDSRRIVSGSIENLASRYGTPLKGDFPHDTMDLAWLDDEASAPEHLRGGKLRGMVKAYNQRDVAILFKVISAVNKELKTGIKSLVYHHVSASGIAMHYYMSEHMPTSRKLRLPTNKYLKDIGRFGYKGGLVQAPGRGKVYKKVYAYDVVSMYPSVMLDCPMPSGQVVGIEQIRQSDYGFVHVVARAPKDKLPCLLPITRAIKNGPVADESRPKLECVRHEELFSGIFLTSEVKAAIDYGYRVAAYGGIKFTPHTGAFKSYVLQCFKLRQERRARGDRAGEQLYKELLNSLYGRLAMRGSFPRHQFLTRSELRALEIKAPHGTVSAQPLQGGNYLVTTQPREGNHYDRVCKMRGLPYTAYGELASSRRSAVQVAAAITAHSRIVISKFKNIPENPIIYSHTDSVVVEHELTDPSLVGENELGKLKFLGV